MPKAKAKAKDDRVPVIAGQMLCYDGAWRKPGELVLMTPGDAATALAMRQVREPRPDEMP